MTQKANVGLGKSKMDKMVGRELPCIRRSKSLSRGRINRGVDVDGNKIKSDDEGKKKQTKGLKGKSEPL
jgi:hypothetical protein